MKIKLKDNSNLQLQTIQNAANVEHLYITNCPNINTWNIFNSIRNTSENVLSHIRLDNISHTGTWTELNNIKNGFHGLNSIGQETENPYLAGVWTLPGMHINNNTPEYDIESMTQIFGGSLSIVPATILITLSDSVANSIVNRQWGFEYDDGLYGASISTIEGITDIGQYFQGSLIEDFEEFASFTGVTELKNGAFANCTALSNISFSSNLTSFLDNVFSGCTSLESITYPSDISYIGHTQTTGCTNLEYVRILKLGSITIQDDTFNGNYKIYVGDGSSAWHDNRIKNTLLADNTWKLYESRIDTWYNKVYKEMLPSSYEKLEYIESDGVHYITPQINLENAEFTNNTRFVADISFINPVTSIYGSEDSGLVGIVGGGLRFTVKVDNNEVPVTFFNSSSWANSTENLYDIDIKSGILKLNENSVHTANMTSYGGYITFFGNSSYKYIGRAYMTRIYENGVLKYDFVPVCKKSSPNEAGLYDVKNDVFYGFNTYSGFGFDKRLITESFERITTASGDYIVVSNLNTEEIRVSKMRQPISTSDYYIPVYSLSEGDKKYNIDTLFTSVNDLESSCGAQEFTTSGSYLPNEIVYNSTDKKPYKFIKQHTSGEWDETEVVEMSAYNQIKEIVGDSQDQQELNISLLSKSPISLDYIKSVGLNCINTEVVHDDIGTTITIKFSYDTFVPGSYIFGNYTSTTTYNTFLRLGDTEGSFVCSFKSRTESDALSGLTKGTLHTITLGSGYVKLDDGDSITIPSVTSGGSNPTKTLGILAAAGDGTLKSDLGVKIYFFKVKKNASLYSKYLYPCIKRGKIGLSNISNSEYIYELDNFELPTNFVHPFYNKNILVKFYDGTKSLNLTTDSLGKCSTSFRKDKTYSVSLVNSEITGYTETNTVINKNREENEKDNCYIFLDKVASEDNYCDITFNISLSDKSNSTALNGVCLLIASAESDSNCDMNFATYAQLTGNSSGPATKTVRCPKQTTLNVGGEGINGYTVYRSTINTGDNSSLVVSGQYTKL